MTYFIHSIYGGNSSYSSYDGMFQADIILLLQNMGHSEIVFISEEDFLAGIHSS